MRVVCEKEVSPEGGANELVTPLLEVDDLEINEDLLMTLPPLANTIVDKTIDNVTRKLISGYRNKNVAKPNAKKVDIGAETKETLKAVSAKSAMEVANRGQVWKEVIMKTFTHGISSLSSMKFDGEFEVVNGEPDGGFQNMPEGPGVYVVFDRQNKPVYVGDSGNMKKRWHAGHLNEYRQGERNGDPYKLSSEFSEGCAVKFIRTETVEAAAAIEAALQKQNFDEFEGIPKNPKYLTEEQTEKRNSAINDGMLKNKREELSTEQGTRSNIEAKKIKDSYGSAARLAGGAAIEAGKNAGFQLVEQLLTTTLKVVKDELVDTLHPRGKKAKLIVRIRRVLRKILAAVKGIANNLEQLLKGIVEFLINALSATVGKILSLARNIFDFASQLIKLYKKSGDMSREEFVRTASETIIISGTLIVWDSLDPVIEGWLDVNSGATLKPFSPYIAAAATAVGFGVTGYFLQAVTTRFIDAIVDYQQGYIETLDAEKAACGQLVANAESELELISDLRNYVDSSLNLMGQLQVHTAALSEHQAIKPLSLSFQIIPSR